jgi:O-antigen ligase
LFVYGGGLLLAWFTYLFVVNHLQSLRTTLAIVIVAQATVGILQFLVQGDLGLLLLGELPLNPAFSGISVIHARNLPWLRAYGLMAHPNLYGALLALCMAIMLTEDDSEVTAKDAGSRHWPVVAIGMSGLFVSFSRAAWLGTVVGLGTWFSVRWRHGWRPSWKGYIWLFILTLTLTIALVMYGDLAGNRFVNLQDPLEARSINQRLSDARIALQLGLQEPVVGVGFGRYVDVAVGVSADAQRVHNVFLLVFAELGLPGLVLVIWLFFGPARALIDVYRRGSSLVAVRGMAPWLVVIVVNQLDTTLWLGGNWQTAILFALAAGHVSRTLSQPAGSESRPPV